MLLLLSLCLSLFDRPRLLRCQLGDSLSPWRSCVLSGSTSGSQGSAEEEMLGSSKMERQLEMFSELLAIL